MRIRCTIGLRKVYRENMALESRKPFVAGVLVGVLATLVFMGTAVLLVSRSPSVENRYKEIVKNSVQEDSVKEQARLHVDCRSMDSELQIFLKYKEIDALFQEYKNPIDW